MRGRLAGRCSINCQSPSRTRPRRAVPAVPRARVPSRSSRRGEVGGGRFDTVARQQVHEEQRDRSNRISWRACTLGGSSGPSGPSGLSNPSGRPTCLRREDGMCGEGVVLLIVHETETETEADRVPSVVGGSWRSGALALCFFVPARLLEGQRPSFQMFDWGAAGGFDDQLQPLPCPVVPCPALFCPARPDRPHGLETCLGWTVGRLAGLGGWIEWKGVGGCGWMDGRLNVGPGMEPSPVSTAVSHLIRQNAGWDWKRAWVERRKKEEKKETSTAHALLCCLKVHCIHTVHTQPHIHTDLTKYLPTYPPLYIPS